MEQDAKHRTRPSTAMLAIGLWVGWIASSWSGAGRVEAGVGRGESAGDLIALTSDLGGSGVQSLVLIDQPRKVLSIYEYDARKTKLKLSAVRHYAGDQELSEYNNDAPFVADIEKLVRQR